VIVFAWKTGSTSATAAGYGIRINREDRQLHFRKQWEYVVIEIDSSTFEVRLSDSFWSDCIELRSKKIGKWLLDQGLAPWPKGKPPRLSLEPLRKRTFRLRFIH